MPHRQLRFPILSRLEPGRGGRGPWTPEKSFEQMEKFGIASAVLSMTQMGDMLYSGNETGRRNVRIGNDYGAKLVQQYPKKFGLFGGVPLPDIDGVMKEIEYCYDGRATNISNRCGRS